MQGRIQVEGMLNSGNAIKVCDNYSSSGSAVKVEAFWCGDGEEIKFRITLLGHKDEDTGREMVWDGIRLIEVSENEG